VLGGRLRKLLARPNNGVIEPSHQKTFDPAEEGFTRRVRFAETPCRHRAIAQHHEVTTFRGCRAFQSVGEQARHRGEKPRAVGDDGLPDRMPLSTLAAVGVGFAAADGFPAVLRVWGAWAVASGAVHLVVGVGRRKIAGHWPMILSGSISVLAGVSFYLGSLDPVPSLQKICGYALLGGLFFLASALRLRFGSKNG
jgi:hypothetical protein